MENLEKTLAQYNYHLPPELIAQKPARPRESARLMVYHKKSDRIRIDTFANIGSYLPKNSVLVFNQTKVVPARLWVKKPTGGKAQILYLGREQGSIKVIADRRLQVGWVLNLADGINFKIQKQKNQFYFLKPNFAVSDISQILNKYGQTPLPPYIKHSPLTERQRRAEYQTVFAKTGLSVAAPTASLHFSKKLIKSLQKQGISTAFITLNVNLGTFAPLTQANLNNGKLHTESYMIDAKTARVLNAAKRAGRPVIAVGTTALRALESASSANKKLAAGPRATNLFIRPGYKFKFIDGLITNFHVPKSSLLMLAAALIGRKKLLGLYAKAVKKRFRFFSFGDGMLIL